MLLEMILHSSSTTVNTSNSSSSTATPSFAIPVTEKLTKSNFL
jgi:hypothetical protein